MKFIKMLSILCLVGLSISAVGQQTLPSVNLKTLDGQAVDLKDYAQEGQVLVISVWATWCAPCKKELDAIADLYPEWQSKYNVELLAITIDTQRQLAKVKPMIATKGWEYTFLSDANNQLRTVMGVQSIPQTFLVDQSGKIVYSHTGYSPGDEYELENQIKLLNDNR